MRNGSRLSLAVYLYGNRQTFTNQESGEVRAIVDQTAVSVTLGCRPFSVRSRLSREDQADRVAAPAVTAPTGASREAGSETQNG